MGFYEEMRDEVATPLLTEFAQGSVSLKRVTPGVIDPDQEWVAPEDTVETWPLKATVKRLHQRYEGGALIVETGDEVTFAVPAVMPLLTDRLVIDGVERVISNLTPLPGAGTVVAWKAWCAA